VYFSMPLLEGGLSVKDWQDHLVSDRVYRKDQALSESLRLQSRDPAVSVEAIMFQVRGMLRDARIVLGKTSSIEISHHYGLERFREFGAVIINVINREYCKKLIVQLPRQKHPYHFHKRKEETFHVLYGDLEVTKEGERKSLTEGDLFLVESEKWHKFATLDGVVFEEISTTHYDGDSFYLDEKINSSRRDTRKSVVRNWEL